MLFADGAAEACATQLREKMRKQGAMVAATETARERILRAFLQLVSERGIEATTTRAVAQEAGVNEVTIFRHFGDKANLARELFRHFGDPQRISSLPIEIDTSTPQNTVEGLLRCALLIHNLLSQRTELVNFGLSEAWRYPDLAQEVHNTVTAGRDYLQRAITAANPMLRPQVDPEACALSLHGLLVLSVIWQARGLVIRTDDEWKRIIEANIRLLVVDPT